MELPKKLYHATYKALLPSIKEKGLGGVKSEYKWEDSLDNAVYLAADPDIASSYAETNDNVPENWLDEIVIFEVDARKLKPALISLDPNIIGNSGESYSYSGVIPYETLKVFEPAEDSEDFQEEEIENEIQGINADKGTVHDKIWAFIDQRQEEDCLDIDVQELFFYGSRLRNTARPDSDLDVVVYYFGDDSEDEVFNSLNRSPFLHISGIKVDFNPIRPQETGHIEDYIKKSEQYDKKILSDMKIEKSLDVRLNKDDDVEMMLFKRLCEHPEYANLGIKAYRKYKDSCTDENDRRLTFVADFDNFLKKLKNMKDSHG